MQTESDFGRRGFLGLGVLFIAVGTTACGSNSSSPGSGSSSGDITIVLKSGDLTGSSLFFGAGGKKRDARLTSQSCQVTVDASTVSGVCATPSQVSGSFSQGNLANTSGGAPVRILGGGTETGLSNIFKRAAFDLKTSPSISGEDNIEGATNTSFTYMTLAAQYIDFAFEATPSQKIYHVRTFFVNNLPSTESSFQATSCRIEDALTEADTQGTLFTGMTAQSGDIMVCVKSSSTETCSDSDYQWVDASGNLSSTRPTSPKRQTSTELITASSCSSDSVTWGYAELNLGFSSSVSVSAKIDAGKKTYTVGSQTGTKLTFTVDVDLENSLFVPSSTGITDLAAANEAAILSNIENIVLKPVYVSKTRTGQSAGDSNSMLSATPTLTVE